MLHVDGHAADVRRADALRQQMRLLLGRQIAQRDVARPVGQQDHQRHHVWVQALLALEDLQRQEQASGERRLAADWNLRQRLARQDDRVGGRQDQIRPILLEDDQADAVAALIGIGQQGEDGAFGRLHPLGDRHAPRGIHHEQDQVGSALDADFALQVLRFDAVGEVAVRATALIGRGGAQGGVKSDVIALSAGWARLDVASALALGARLAAPPRRLAREAV